MKKIVIFLMFAGLTILFTSCATTPEHMPKPEPGTKKIVTIYDTAKDNFTSVPGSMVSNNEIENIRTDGQVEEYYNGRYIDPVTGDMYGKSTIYRITSTPHWNTTPNPDVKPYEVDEAYKHIKNIANASPLYAELDNKNHVTDSLNKTLRLQLQEMQKVTVAMQNQQQQIQEYKSMINKLTEENKKLIEEQSEKEKKVQQALTQEKIFKSSTAADKGINEMGNSTKSNNVDTGINSLNI